MPPAEYVDAPAPVDQVVEVWDEAQPRLARFDGRDWRCIGSGRVLAVVQGWREVPAAKVLL